MSGALQAVILDIRFPTLPVAELQRHQAPVNALAWAPALVLPHLHGRRRCAGTHLGPDHHGQAPGAEPGCALRLLATELVWHGLMMC